MQFIQGAFGLCCSDWRLDHLGIDASCVHLNFCCFVSGRVLESAQYFHFSQSIRCQQTRILLSVFSNAELMAYSLASPWKAFVLSATCTREPQYRHCLHWIAQPTVVGCVLQAVQPQPCLLLPRCLLSSYDSRRWLQTLPTVPWSGGGDDKDTTPFLVLIFLCLSLVHCNPVVQHCYNYCEKVTSFTTMTGDDQQSALNFSGPHSLRNSGLDAPPSLRRVSSSVTCPLLCSLLILGQ